jgi:hypothetical protein
MVLIEDLIYEVRTHDAALADELAGLACNSEYDKILSVIQNAKA